jgi:hypothetical protein
VLGKDTVAIVNQVLVSLFEPNRLAQLVQCPSGSWVGCDIAMDQAPAMVLDYHEHIQQPELGGGGNKEVAGDDSLRMQAQES